ncbi:MAG: cytochrome c, partial [Myxococcota bacterium]
MNTPKLHAMKTLSALTLSAAILTLGATVSAQEVTYWDGTTDEPVSCKPDVRKEIKTKTTSTPEQLKIGQAKYNAICSACHGEKGLGNGAAAAALNPKPRNLVKEPYKKGTSILALYDIVTNGLEGTQMAGFEAALSEPERCAVSHYVQNEFLPQERVETMTDKP